MNVLDLFSGIGGFSLGLERAGFRTAAFCEREPFCQRVLAHHWPRVPIYDDVRILTGDRLRADGISVDVIAGGFPCQDISHAARERAKGLAGERSGLWFEMARIIRDVRPSWVVIENVPRLRTLGADRVLDDLESAGYAPAPPMVVGAVHAGAPHLRKRVWIVAYAQGIDRRRMDAATRDRPKLASGVARDGADADGESQSFGSFNGEVARVSKLAVARAGPWQVGPFDGDEVADGLPADMDDALRAYGNSVVPQITEAIGRAIMNTSKHLHDVRCKADER